MESPKCRHDQHALFVCTNCGSSHEAKQDGVKSDGERLLEKLQRLSADWALQDNFAIQPVECMGVCDQACAIAFVSPHKQTYLFGSLPADAASVAATATAVLTCAGQYHAKPDGLLPYAKRPELLRAGAIARIPPMPTQCSAVPQVNSAPFS
jgi:predicted metal-binding protein